MSSGWGAISPHKAPERSLENGIVNKTLHQYIWFQNIVQEGRAGLSFTGAGPTLTVSAQTVSDCEGLRADQSQELFRET